MPHLELHYYGPLRFQAACDWCQIEINVLTFLLHAQSELAVCEGVPLKALLSLIQSVEY